MFLGIEIGGTKLQLGVGTGDGAPLRALERFDVQAEQGRWESCTRSKVPRRQHSHRSSPGLGDRRRLWRAGRLQGLGAW